MKTATLPAIRVEPELRADVESVLTDGETLSQFVEAAVRTGVERRRVDAAFIARGLAARDAAMASGDWVDADVVLQALERKVAAARTKRTTPRR